MCAIGVSEEDAGKIGYNKTVAIGVHLSRPEGRQKGVKGMVNTALRSV